MLLGTFLSLLLLTVPFRVEGNSTTTVTLFDFKPASVTGSYDNGEVVSKASAIGLGPNGGTVYEEVIAITSLVLVVPESSGVITSTVTNNIAPLTATVVQAASWVYVSSPDQSGKFNNYERNCTLGMNGTTGECIEVFQGGSPNGTSIMTTITTTYAGEMVPLYTVTVTGSIPTSTSTSAAMIVGNPTFEKLLSLIFLVVMLIFGF